MDYHLRLKGFVGGWDFDADYTQYILDKYAGQPVNVCIDSMGGLLNTGLSISAAFKAHGDVTVHYVSMNASAATIASLGAKRVTMDADAWYLVHKSSFNISEYAQMNSDQIEDFIATLEKAKAQLLKYDLGIAAAYARRCKKTPEQLYELMEKETFISAQEALDWGFIDEITDSPEDPAPVLDEVTERYCIDNAIVIPEALLATRPGKHRDDDQSFIDRIVASVKSAFTPKSHNMEKSDEMEKEKRQDVTPGTADTHEASGGAPENTAGDSPGIAPDSGELAAVKAERDSLLERNRELQARIDSMPAASHSQVVETEQSGQAKLRSNLSKGARDLYNMLP